MKYLMMAFLIIVLVFGLFTSTYAEESDGALLFNKTGDGKLVLEGHAEQASDAVRFDGAYPFHYGLSIVIRDGFYGAVNLHGDEILPCKFTSIAVYQDAIVACLNDRYTLMNKLGTPVTDISYQEIYDNGYGFVTIDKDQCGLIDSAGINILDRKWMGIGAYCDGWMQIVDSDYSCNYINPFNKLLPDRWADWCTYFSNGYAAFGVDNKIYMTDTQGNVRQMNFSDVDLFPKNGVFLVKDTNGDAGIYDAAKDTFTICSVEWFGAFSENMIAIKCGDKWGYCNLAGEIAIKPIYDEVRRFSEGFAPVRLGNTWTYIDPLGNPINSSAYAQAYEFCEGYAACVDLEKEKLGFIDRSGQWIIQPDFPIIREVYFQNGICNLGGYDPWEGCFIDKEGNILWEFHLDLDYFK